MLFGLFAPKYKQESIDVFNSAVKRAGGTFSSVFHGPSKTKEERDVKFEAISVYMALYVSSLQYHEAQKNYRKLLETIYETMFDRYEISLREQGVSDVKVGPAVRAYAAKFKNRLMELGNALEVNDTKAVVTYLQEKELCDEVSAKKMAITLCSEASMLKKLNMEAFLAHLQHPQTGAYEPHLEQTTN